MCGIVGIIGKETTGKSEIVREMARVIHHRGPDEDGFFDDEFVSLGMRRLSIIDLGGGTQPITSADGNLLIFFNGEIYNYQELRTDLEKKGYVFKTNSDTETILHTYEAYGKAGLTNLRGMFAFSIYDKASHLLFVARDFFGIKPLYYLTGDNPSGNSGKKMVLGFGSEIKALLEHPKMKMPGALQVNDAALFDYLRFQYNPHEETFFKNIFTLRPGHCMTVDLLADTFETERFWHMDFAPDETVTEERLAEKTRDTMRDSVAHHMIADVPVASFLSGGVDSSIIATLMQEIRNKDQNKVKTFTIGFKEISEGDAARETSDMIGTDHTEITVSAEEYFSVLPKLVWHFDEPVADPSAIALYFIAREARKQVKVVLSGEGADELFGGYNIYRTPIESQKIAWLPKNMIAFLARIWPDMYGKQYLTRASTKLEEWYIGNASIFTPSQRANLWKKTVEEKNLPPILPKILAETYAQARSEHLSDSTTMQLVDINTWLVGDILAKADKMTMANSLELRVPFLDTGVAALARTLPDNMKWTSKNIAGNTQATTKYILRKAFENIIPKTTTDRRKLGFPTPIKHWLTGDNNHSREVFDTIRQSPLLQSRFHMDEIEKIITNHTSNTTDNSRKIYLFYMLALWHKVFFEKLT